MDFDLATIVQKIATMMPAFLIALVVHEFAHAWMATKFGDKTSEWSGRLTLNPTAHIDPMGTIAFPLLSIVTGAPIFFGWAKPVPIDTRQFSNYRSGLFWVAFAGPLSNILLGFVTGVALIAFLVWVPRTFVFFDGATAIMNSLLVWNFSLAIFNLLPIPPLDGSNMVLSFLNYENARRFMAIQQYSFFLLLFLMFTGALKYLGIPISILVQLSIELGRFVFGA